MYKNIFLFLGFIIFFLLLAQCNIMRPRPSHNMRTEVLQIDSVYSVELYKVNRRVAAIEYRTLDQVIKVGILDTSAVFEYLQFSPYVANDLFIYHCASCHSLPPSFSEGIKGEVPGGEKQLKAALCSPAHNMMDSLSCQALNNFEIFLLSRYLNKYKN